MRYVIGLLALGVIVSGCSGGTTASDPDLKPAEPKTTVAANWPTDVKIHRNEKGEVVCPIMKDAIASPEKAVGYQDYEGKRYYFCCDMCPQKFKDDPKTYAMK